MIDKLSNQSRIIIATVLSFLFFATYNYFFIPKQEVTEQKTQVEKAQKVGSQPITSVAPSSSDIPSQVSKKSVEIITKVQAASYELHIDRLGRISKFYLNETKYKDENGDRIELIDSELVPYPLEIRFSDENINSQAFATSYTASESEIKVADKGTKLTLTQSLSDLKIVKTLTFFPNGNYDLSVTMSNPKEYFITPGFRPNVGIDSYTFHGSLIKEADETLSVIDDGDATGKEAFANAIFAASSDKYYTTLFYNFDKGLDVVVSPVYEESPLLFIKGKNNLKLSGYLGPKEHTVLVAIDKRLTDVIEYGFFTFISRPLFMLLQYLHSILGNWGWSIVCMTLLIRLVLFPLTYKGMVSMNKLKALSPKIKELQAKYGKDKQKLNTHMMELYKKHGANPMGGCLPIVLQIPVFFAIYRVLQNTIELKAAPWILWIHDLAVMDPYFVLPIAMGLTMFFHQRITPTNFTDPMQEKIMKFLPLIFTFFFVSFPAGLTLYWFVNNLFSIAQQYYVNSLFAKGQKAEITEKKAKK
ncbi:membrane protein insertase YidC [Sulfurospirillum arcachonense]|uniref:membrane protein insertase YidC n=1 Tax=Sulfurospirillum arcachonense TaxID=57666 RepID=UPI0004686F11|nr:membrane protein insertase YidC [Sulfurospirillum arcachonense]